MKKLVMVLIAFSLSSNTWAARVNPNCDNVKVHLQMGVDDHFEAIAKWKIINAFPKASEEKEIGDNLKGKNPSFSFECPDISASYDGEVIELKSSDYDTLLSRLSLGYFDDDYELDLFSYSWYTYPNILMDRHNESYGFDIKKFEFASKAKYFPIVEGKKLDFMHGHIPNTAVVGYRVDDGILKPLLFERMVSEHKQELVNSNTINIYHKNPNAGNKGQDIQRIFIDKKNAILKIYRNNKFPDS